MTSQNVKNFAVGAPIHGAIKPRPGCQNSVNLTSNGSGKIKFSENVRKSKSKISCHSTLNVELIPQLALKQIEARL